MRFLGIGSLLFCSLSAWAATNANPSFRCRDGEGIRYEVWIGEDQNRLGITDQKKTREILLTGARSNEEQAPLAYLGWNPKGADVLSRYLYAHEFRVQYRSTDNGAEAVVSLVVDDRERPKLKCQISGIAVPVVAADSLAPSYTRHAELLSQSARLRTRDGELSPFGLLGVEAAIRRFVASPEFSQNAARGEFVARVRTAVRDLSLPAVGLVQHRLKGAAADYWKQLLEAVQYRYAPESQRYADWVKQGLESGTPEINSVTAGLNAFVRSREFAQKDIREFFTKETQPGLQKLSPEDATEIKVRLDVPAQKFLAELLGAGPSPLSAAAAAEVGKTSADIQKLMAAPEPESRKIAQRLSAFLATGLGRDRRAQKILIETVGPLFKKLTPRQREDLLAWCEDFNEQLLVQRLLR